MRTVTYGAACSLDGLIAGPKGEIDWIRFSEDARQIMEAYWQSIDTVLLGRKTYEQAVNQGGSSGGFPGVKTYLFSRTLKTSPSPHVELVSRDAGEVVASMKKLEGGGICVMGGGELARSLFQAGVIDEVGLSIHPVLLGSGTPVFRDPGKRVSLTLLESRAMDGGCIYANYRVGTVPDR